MDQAIAHFQMALALKPDLAEVHNDLGMVYVHLGKTEQAISHLRTALALNPDDQHIRHNLANVLEDKKVR